MGLRLLAADTAQGTEVENTTTEGALASYTCPADFWKVGKTVLISGGCIVVDNNSTDTLTLRLRFGGSTTPGSNTALAVADAVDAADADLAAVWGTLTCRTVGTAGTFAFSGFISTPDAAAATVIRAGCAVISSIDTTAATYIDYTATWSVAHADNEVASEAFVVLECNDG